MTSECSKPQASLESLALELDKDACSQLLTNVYLAKNPSYALMAYFKEMGKGRKSIAQALFYKGVLTFSLRIYEEMKKYGNDHLEKHREFMNCIVVVVMSICGGISKDELAPTLMNSKSNKRMEYLNEIWNNYDVIVKYANRLLQDEVGKQFVKAASLLQAA